MNRRPHSKCRSHLHEKNQRQSKRDSEKKNGVFLKPAGPNPSRGIVKRKFAPKKAPEPTDLRGKEGKENRKSAPRKYVIASTPLNTPVKLEKVKERQGSDTDSLSDISKNSKTTSSICSSVSSGLIELLCSYNSSVLEKKGKPDLKEPSSSLSNTMVDLDATPKAATTYSFVVPTDQPNCQGRVDIVTKLIVKLQQTVASVVSSGDTKSLKRMEKIVETMKGEISELSKEIPLLLAQKQDIQAEIELAMQPLQNENAALQRKLRIANQRLIEKEKFGGEKDLNLELETLQCMNNSLMEQMKKTSALLQQMQEEKQKQNECIDKLRRDNVKLSEELVSKDIEFNKSREIFSTEAGSIKQEVANAIRNVETLKHNLNGATTEGELMKISLQEKDEEIARLNDLNKGLQNSVSRLLEDLRKSSRPQNNLKPSVEMSSAFLKNLQELLNKPAHPREIQRNSEITLTNYPSTSMPQTRTDAFSVPETPVKDDFAPNFLKGTEFEVLESSRLSSAPIPSGSSSLMSLPQSRFNPLPPHQVISNMNSFTSSSWQPSSVSSSFVSFCTRDENDFANGLALLDADIQRLQESLHDRSLKKTM